MPVVEETVEHGADRRRISQQLAPILDGPIGGQPEHRLQSYQVGRLRKVIGEHDALSILQLCAVGLLRPFPADNKLHHQGLSQLDRPPTRHPRG